MPEKAAGTPGPHSRKEYIGGGTVVVLKGSLWACLFYL